MLFISWLENCDKIAFTYIQKHVAAPWLDNIMLVIRNPYTWIPLYIFMFYQSLRFRRSVMFKFICCTLICFAFTDFMTAHLLKPFFGRPRPCYDSDTMLVVRGIIGCGGKFSFPSSHAANHFGLASFWYYSLFQCTKRKWRWLWIWALIISFAQVYVGVHFPLDITGGALLGIICGTGAAKFFEIWTGAFPADASNNSSLSLP